jgi:SAM-dependent methyltransferase
MSWASIWDRRGRTRDLLPHEIDGFALDSEGYSSVVGELTSRLPLTADSSVLECGCGAGAFLLELRARYEGVRLTGVDYSQSLVDRAVEFVPGADVRRADITDLSVFSNDKFDCVVTYSVYQYLPTLDAARQALREAIRVCRPGGTVMIGDVNDAEQKALATELRGDDPSGPKHLYLHQDFFIQEAAALGVVDWRIIDHQNLQFAAYNPTARYRFSIYLTKPVPH